MFPFRRIFRLGSLLMGSCLLLQPSLAGTGNATTVRIGVLAYKGAEAVEDDWYHVRNWLEASVTGHRFVLLDFDQAGLSAAVRAQTLDFAIASSGHYVALEDSDGANRIATIESPWALSPAQSIGLAIVVRKDARLHTLADLAGKQVLAVGPEAFGGYQIAARELLAAGVDPEHDLASLR